MKQFQNLQSQTLYYCIHRSLWLEAIQSYPQPLSDLLEISFNTVLMSVLQSSKLCHPFRFFTYSFVSIHAACHWWFDNPINVHKYKQYIVKHNSVDDFIKVYFLHCFVRHVSALVMRAFFRLIIFLSKVNYTISNANFNIIYN
jgi:hypothetical protein